ncbi:HAMP domain-containing sensor histidine kinase [Streptomyces sp. NPDC026659]|uniref:sensor histidine kinase n=1 Tax=Streptomyces sp. NPDC026659 TaxID=3155123 RepID=UPI0033E12218
MNRVTRSLAPRILRGLAPRTLRRLTPRTLRGRLSLAALTAAALVVTVLTVAFNVVTDRHLRHQADDALRDRAAAVAATVDTSGSRVRVIETANDRLLDTDAWIYAGGRLLDQEPGVSVAGPPTRVAHRLALRRATTCATAPGHRPVRLCALAVAGTTVTVVTALDLGPYRNSADTLLLGSLLLDGVMLLCTYVLTRLAVGRALRPVRTMTDQATQRGATGSADRFGDERRPVELALLGASLDALLDRIRSLLRYERQLTGELSHELRTPLTRIIIELDWWRARPRTADETRATHEAVADAARSMRTICDTLLRDARESALAPTTVPGTTDVVPVLAGLLRRLDPPQGVKTELDTAEPELHAGVPTALLERVVSPLLANAVRYARTRVTVSAGRVPGAVRIDVVDDGPGVPRAFTGELFQPGQRADPDDGHDGAGLGLPLARRLARGVGGDVTYAPGRTTGATFTVSLPAG